MRTYVRLGVLLAVVVVAVAVLARAGTPAYAWSYPAALNTNAATDGGRDTWPHLTADSGGHWVAVWYSDEDLGGTIGTDKDILVARSTDNGATWTAPAALNTNAATDSGDDYEPQVATDGGGNWLAVWWSNEANVGGGIATDYDILMASSTDNGATWTAPAALTTNAATDSGGDNEPQVATDGGGNWVTVWHSNEADVGGGIGTDADILYATEYIGPPAPVGGVAELPEVSDSAGRNYIVMAGLAAAALVALGAGGWYARRRFSRS